MDKYNMTNIIEIIQSNEMIDYEVMVSYFGSFNGSHQKICTRAMKEWNITSISVLPPQCWPQRYKFGTIVVLYVMLTILFLGTFIGNALMIFSFLLVRRLRTPCNMLIINLAVTDLMVGILIIPMASIYQIKGYWMFDDYLCGWFILFDVLLCTSSILNLCAISVDRYFIITQPFRYATRRTPKTMLLMILIVWVASALISVPPLFGWSKPKSKYSCDYSENLGYQIYATFIAFYLPLIVMLILYGRIFRLANYIVNQEQIANKKPKICKVHHLPKHVGNSSNLLNENQTNSDNFQQLRVPSVKVNFANSNEEFGNLSRCKDNFGKRNAEAKAIRTLGVIMGCFTICWLPFFIVQLLNPVFRAMGIEARTSVSEVFFQIFYWLGYTNSFLNPVIYAIFNKEFRTPLEQIIKCRCKTIEDILRSEKYYSQYGTSQLKSSKSIKDVETPINRRRSPQRVC